MAATNLHGKAARKYPEKDSLFFKLQGQSQESLREAAKVVRQVAEKHGGTGFEVARNEKDATDLWNDRKNVHLVGNMLSRVGRGWITDMW
jgi:D-lactate dehydrogenase (cytochrome)